MSYARRTDTQHAAIRKVLRQCGYEVRDTSHARDFVDLVACKGDRIWLIEIKTAKSKTGRVQLTESQRELEKNGWPVVYLATVDDALAWVKEQR